MYPLFVTYHLSVAFRDGLLASTSYSADEIAAHVELYKNDGTVKSFVVEETTSRVWCKWERE